MANWLVKGIGATKATNPEQGIEMNFASLVSILKQKNKSIFIWQQLYKLSEILWRTTLLPERPEKYFINHFLHKTRNNRSCLAIKISNA